MKRVLPALAAVSALAIALPAAAQSWLPINARQAVLDATYGEIGGEAGWQLTRTLSAYGRPSFGLGTDNTKPYSWAVTVGVRWVP